MYLRSTCSDRNYAKQRYAAQENKRRTELSGKLWKRAKRKNSTEEKGENERRRKRAAVGEGKTGIKKEKGNKNGWWKSVSCKLRLSSESTLVESACHCGHPIRVLTHLMRICKEGYEGRVQRDEKFSWRPPASKSCLCMTMLRLADDPH